VFIQIGRPVAHPAKLLMRYFGSYIFSSAISHQLAVFSQKKSFSG
jgi:hypothetical protein